MRKNRRLIASYFAIATIAVISSGQQATYGQQSPDTTNWTITNSSIREILNDDSARSTSGKDFKVVSLKKGSGNGPRFFIQGGLHGNEKKTSVLVLWMIQRLESGIGPLKDLPAGSEIDFLPFASPDTYGQSRYNTNNINLNRNFGILWGMSREPNGNRPISEAETKAITQLMKQRGYLAAVDVHGYVEWIVAPTEPSKIPNGGENQKANYWKWLSILEKHRSLLPKYKLKTAGSLGDGGAFEDWAYWGNNTLSFCLEMSRSSMKSEGIDPSFFRYENFIASVFTSATTIQNLDPSVAIATKRRLSTPEAIKARGQFNSFDPGTVDIPSF